MKGWIVACAVLLVGCSSVKTLEELEFAAMESGDWSAVESREKNVQRRKQHRAVSCGSGTVPICEERVRGTVCKCRSDMRIDDGMVDL